MYEASSIKHQAAISDEALTVKHEDKYSKQLSVTEEGKRLLVN